MDPSRFTQATRLFEEAHREDPRTLAVRGETVPWSLHYHRRMRHWLDRLEPNPSEALKLAAHGQHIRRWTVPRTDYAEGRDGYRKWRRELAAFHAEEAGRILRRCGYDAATAQRVGDLLLKKGIKTDPETQTLEDVICLVFLENEFGAFARRHDEEKILAILRKTWAKMSDRGHREARRLLESETIPAEAAQLLRKALS